MKTEIKEINSYTRKLNVIVKWDSLVEEYDKEYKKARSKYTIPGFRKGKVPEQIVKKNIGPVIDSNFAESSLNQYYRKAIEKLKLNPINQAKINDLNFKEGLDLSFTAEFEVEPEIKLPNYQNKIKVRAIRYVAGDEDIDQALSQYKEQHANVKSIETGAKSGHFIRGDFQILNDDGQPRKGSKLDNQYIRLGFGLFKDEKEKVFLESKKGDKVKVSIPGKEHDVTYEVSISSVEEQILPEMNDELARNINENAKNLDDLRRIIRDQIQTSLDKDHESLVQKEIINFFVNKAKIEAPKSMVERYLSHVKEDLKQRKQEINESELKKTYESVAELNIKWYLMKGLLIENEKVNVSKTELENKIKALMDENKDSKNQIADFYGQDENKQKLFDEMLNEKLFEKLKENAKIKVDEQSTKELRKQQSQ